jgi:hypothetical protein
MKTFTKLYGENPLHLLAHLAGFAIGGFALFQIVNNGAWINFAAFFVGAALLHDMVLLPFYAAIDKLAIARRGPRPYVNHIRVPAVISAILLLIYLPLISGKSDASYRAAVGHNPHGYLRNWLLITAGLFVASGCVFVLKAWRRQPGPG